MPRPSVHRSAFHADPLADGELLQGLPLVQATWPHVDERAWTRYVDFVLDRAPPAEAGVVGLRDEAGYLSGLLVYEVELGLNDGRVLTIHLFTAADLASSAAPAIALLDAARAKAADLACAALQVRVYSGQEMLAAQLQRLGLSDRAGYLWQAIAARRPH